MKVVYKTAQLKFEGMSQNQVMVLKFCNVKGTDILIYLQLILKINLHGLNYNI